MMINPVVFINLNQLVLLVVLMWDYNRKSVNKAESKFFNVLVLTNMLMCVLPIMITLFENSPLIAKISEMLLMVDMIIMVTCLFAIYSSENVIGSISIKKLIIFMTIYGTFWTLLFSYLEVKIFKHTAEEFSYFEHSEFLLIAILPLVYLEIKSFAKKSVSLGIKLIIPNIIAGIILDATDITFPILAQVLLYPLLIIYIKCITNLMYLDNLTGTYNRKFLRKDIIIKQGFIKERPIKLFIIDVDKFKRINDRYGHVYGDKVLFKMGHTLSNLEYVFEKSFCVRYGGDEFLLVLQSPHPEEKIKEIIRKEVNEIPDLIEPVNVSIGSESLAWEKIDHISDMIGSADEKMYREKFSK